MWLFTPHPSKTLLSIEYFSLFLYLPPVIDFAYKIKVVSDLTNERVAIAHSSELTWCEFPYKKDKSKYVS